MAEETESDKTTPSIEPIDTAFAISSVRRSAAISMALRIALLAGVSVGFVMVGRGMGMVGGSLMAAAIAVLLLLSGRSVRTQQSVARASNLIGAGQFDEAEKTLAEGLRSLLLYRAPRLGMLQNLAALRHAQRRFGDAAMIAAELLRQGRNSSDRPLKLMLAECALELNDLQTAHSALSQIPPVLPVREMLKLMELQVEYCVRIGAWPAALDQLPMKVELAELLPAEPAARVQGLLALAAHREGRADWSSWLKRRAELLTDIPRLVQARPMLRELWS